MSKAPTTNQGTVVSDGFYNVCRDFSRCTGINLPVDPGTIADSPMTHAENSWYNELLFLEPDSGSLPAPEYADAHICYREIMSRLTTAKSHRATMRESLSKHGVKKKTWRSRLDPAAEKWASIATGYMEENPTKAPEIYKAYARAAKSLGIPEGLRYDFIRFMKGEMILEQERKSMLSACQDLSLYDDEKDLPRLKEALKDETAATQWAVASAVRCTLQRLQKPELDIPDPFPEWDVSGSEASEEFSDSDAND